MRIAGVVKESCVDGPGMRFVVFTQGCMRACPGCHNQHTWAMDGGYEISIEHILEMIKEEAGFIDGITVSGGEPMLQEFEVAELLKQCKQLGLNTMMFTGYVLEELDWENHPIFKNLDYVIDGPFIQTMKSMNLKFRGSSNQRLIDVNESLKQHKICEIFP